MFSITFSLAFIALDPLQFVYIKVDAIAEKKIIIHALYALFGEFASAKQRVWSSSKM